MAGGTLATPNGANVDLVKVCQVEAEEGCTYTQGYWKTHAEEGSKKYDETWDLLADGPDTAFFGTSMSWIAVFNTPPKGNPYFILAHQYMAAKLNVLAGAADGDVGADLTAAEAFFGAFTPTSTLTPETRAEIIALADDLDEYNNGLIGPGHCGDEYVAE
jgi:hypothetical protein